MATHLEHHEKPVGTLDIRSRTHQNVSCPLNCIKRPSARPPVKNPPRVGARRPEVVIRIDDRTVVQHIVEIEIRRAAAPGRSG